MADKKSLADLGALTSQPAPEAPAPADAADLVVLNTCHIR